MNSSNDTSEPSTSINLMLIDDVRMGPISLDTPVAQLNTDLAALDRREARLFDAGITCELKRDPYMSCLACPVSKAQDDSDVKCGLCRIGVTQEVTTAMLLAKEREADGVERH